MRICSDSQSRTELVKTAGNSTHTHTHTTLKMLPPPPSSSPLASPRLRKQVQGAKEEGGGLGVGWGVRSRIPACMGSMQARACVCTHALIHTHTLSLSLFLSLFLTHRGCFVTFPGSAVHGGRAITRGTRYIIALFLYAV